MTDKMKELNARVVKLIEQAKDAEVLDIVAEAYTLGYEDGRSAAKQNKGSIDIDSNEK